MDLAAGDHASAVAYLEESVLVWRARGWRSFLVGALQALGRAYDRAGLPDSAEARAHRGPRAGRRPRERRCRGPVARRVTP
ncbi:hypothetical protein F7Q99_26000 [Streptomyces kaniharaensis]|uniref:Tetratricopeptide repeat protein n=1 Tax=Streptomyces kaniharaensis TaxID=212423 RepID=A0A6N7KYK2_9ACTN|nr:hypothetical protein [Streptomyces kaniharaensis]MQS15629.1 hypothetical protein [Streptomyces kaniharaensis]